MLDYPRSNFDSSTSEPQLTSTCASNELSFELDYGMGVGVRLGEFTVGPMTLYEGLDTGTHEIIPDTSFKDCPQCSGMTTHVHK